MSEPDDWAALRRFTAARIGLGRTGVSLPTAKALEFQAAHAAARTAVHEALDASALALALKDHFAEPAIVHSMAPSRSVYLRRPDLGRRLDEASAKALAPAPADVAVIIADGLSARAVQAHSGPLLDVLLPRLRAERLTCAPLTIVLQGRVAVGDEIGALLGARIVVMLIGERPGLSSADSLGIYVTYDPKPGRTDAQRNCISNVRDGGLTYEQAAYRTHYLVVEGLKRQETGVALKDETVELDGLPGGSPRFLLPDKA